jgi:hypothetical protein
MAEVVHHQTPWANGCMSYLTSILSGTLSTTSFSSASRAGFKLPNSLLISSRSRRGSSGYSAREAAGIAPSSSNTMLNLIVATFWAHKPLARALVGLF